MKKAVRNAFLGLASAAMLTTGIVVVQSAHAAGETEVVAAGDTDRIQTLFKACFPWGGNAAYKCEFTGTGQKEVDGPAEIVGSANGSKKFLNCATSGFLRETLSWSNTVESSSTTGAVVGVTQEVSTIFASLEVSGQISHETSTSTARTFTAATQIEVEAGHVGWVFHIPKMNTVTTTLNATETGGEQIHWVLPEMTLKAPTPNGDGTVGVGGDLQNDAEKAQCAAVGRPTAGDTKLLEVNADGRKP